ncbi:MAG: hypothetical protein ACOZIN_22035 [Myxococcota bacterium]
MANLLRLFLAPDDEVAFFRFLERFRLEVYPRRVPPDWKPFAATAEAVPRLPEEEVYLAASDIAPVLVDRVKRGPDKGFWRVDEVRSPVIFYERSRMNEDGELLSGKLWAELDITQQTGRRDPAPERFRRLYLEVEEWLKKTFRKGDPKVFLIGPKAARLASEGLVLRDSEHRGGTVGVHR